MSANAYECLCLVVLLTLTACSVAEAPVEYSAARGVLIATIRAPLDETWVAARAGMDALQLRPYDLDKGNFSAVIVGDTAEGQEIRVSLRAVTRSTTEVTIHIVGLREREPLERIREALIDHL